MTIAEQGRKLQQEISRLPAGRSRRYSSSLRQRVAAWCAQAQRTGVSWPMMSDALGIPVQTLTLWRNAKPRRPELVAVEVVAEQQSSAIAVVAPSGIRIEGITLDQAVAALRALR